MCSAPDIPPPPPPPVMPVAPQLADTAVQQAAKDTRTRAQGAAGASSTILGGGYASNPTGTTGYTSNKSLLGS